MALTHISDTEAVRDFAGVLAKLKAGDEIVIESGTKPIAFLRPAVGRLLSESIAMGEAGPRPVMDEDFAADMREVVGKRKPRDTAAWD